MRPKYFNSNSVDIVDGIKEVFDDLVYQPNWFSINPSNIHTVIDVGALVGSFTLWALEQWPNAKIHSYEPNPESFQFLTQNISSSDAKNRVESFNQAIWSKNQELKLHKFKNLPGCSSVVYEHRPYVLQYEDGITVEAISIIDALNKIGGTVDLLKVDCEGAEYDIIYSLSEHDLNMIKYIVIEYHEFDKDPKRNAVKLLKYLRKMGFAAQIVPSDIRPNMGLGYIYAARFGELNNFLNNIFDYVTIKLLDNLSSVEKIKIRLFQLQQEFDERSKWALDLDTAVKERDSRLSKLQQEFDERSKWALDLDTAVKERDSKLSQLDTAVKERDSKLSQLDTAVKERDSKLSQLDTAVKERDSKLSQLDTAVKERDSKLSQLDTAVKERDSKLSQLDTAVKERDSKLSQLDTAVKERDSKLSQLDTAVKERDSKLSQLDTAVKERDSKLSQLDTAVKERDSRLAKLQQEFDERTKWALDLDLELNSLKHSFIFKMVKKTASFIDKAVPRGTTRHEFLRLVIESTRIIRTNGWMFYFKECKTKLNSISLLRRMEYKIRKPSPIPKQYLETTNTHVLENDSQIISCTKKLEPDPRLRNFMQYGSHNITNLSRRPLVSIIIPTYNAVDLLKLNLESIESLTTYQNYEIIIVTNNLDSNSPTRKYLEKSKHQVLVYPGEYSFSLVNNFAAKKAKGEFLLFLNDDVKISAKNWLESMLKLGLNDDVGAVGAKLLFPDGKLQEAGGIIWKNGFGWNYGRNKDPQDPKYNFVREVDYCSASCLMVKKSVFDKIGGFDDGFKIAYCEDSDLCFTIRKHGYKVLYQPLAEVVHFEGSTQGTDVNNGIKSQQLENQKIFHDKWKDEIKNHYHDSEENSHFQSYRKPGLHILYIDHYVPEYDKDAGSVTAFNFISILASMGHKITFWPENLNRSEPYTTELQQKGVEVIYGPNNFEEFLKKRSHVYAICVMARPHISIHFIDKVKEHIPKCRIIYEASDLHYIRIFREADVTKSEKLIAEAEQSKKTELDLMRKSHLSLFRGEKECSIAINEDKSLLTAAAPLALYYDGKWKSFDERQDLVFVGGYNHPPNVDAVAYFISEIFPIIRDELPNVKFHVIGSNVPEVIRNLCTNNKNCVLVGYVPEISDYLINCRVMVAPLRYGAGVKGKITQSMMHHLPVVTTSIGAEGISQNDDLLLTSDDPKEFANKVVTLYKNKDLWNKLADNAYEFANIHYSPESVRDVFAQVIRRLAS